MNIIEVAGVSKAFSIPSVRRATVREHLLGILEPRRMERLQVLDSVDFRVRQGETLGIMGPNGSGKSTLLKILCGIYQPDRGHVIARGGLTPVLELGVGWNPELDAVDNVYLIGSVMGLSLGEIRKSLDDILSFAELNRFASTKLKFFSSGMASRLAYSVAFRAVRDVLILDEIFAVGDAGFRRRCEERHRHLRKLGLTVIVVSHSPQIVAEFCDRCLLLVGGRIAADGLPDRVVQEYLNLSLRDQGPLTTSHR